MELETPIYLSKNFTPVKYKCHMILHLAFELYLAEDQILLFDMY